MEHVGMAGKGIHDFLLKEYPVLPHYLWLQTLDLLIVAEGAMLEVSGTPFQYLGDWFQTTPAGHQLDMCDGNSNCIAEELDPNGWRYSIVCQVPYQRQTCSWGYIILWFLWRAKIRINQEQCTMIEKLWASLFNPAFLWWFEEAMDVALILTLI